MKTTIDITAVNTVTTAVNTPSADLTADITVTAADVDTATITSETTLGELLSILNLGEKPAKTPTPKKLFETGGEPIATDECCTVFTNGFALYDNGSGRTVFWLPDCVDFTYYFVKPKDSEKDITPEKTALPEGLLGSLPWTMAVTLIGDHRVEENLMNRTGSRAGTKDFDTDDNGDKDRDAVDAVEEAAERGFLWQEDRFGENPEDAYIRKEQQMEMLDRLTDKQREVFILYYRYGYTQQEIADMLGVSKPAVCVRLSNVEAVAKNFFKKNCS